MVAVAQILSDHEVTQAFALMNDLAETQQVAYDPDVEHAIAALRAFLSNRFQRMSAPSPDTRVD